MMQKRFIEEKGKWEGGKQWVHLRKCNVKSRCTIDDVPLWEGETLTKQQMEELAWEADPNFKPFGPSVPKQSNTARGVWQDP